MYCNGCDMPVNLSSYPREYFDLSPKQENYLEELLKRHQNTDKICKNESPQKEDYSLAATNKALMEAKSNSSKADSSGDRLKPLKKQPVYLPPFLRNRGEAIGVQVLKPGMEIGDTCKSCNSVRTIPDNWRTHNMDRDVETPLSMPAISSPKMDDCCTPHVMVTSSEMYEQQMNYSGDMKGRLIHQRGRGYSYGFGRKNINMNEQFKNNWRYNENGKRQYDKYKKISNDKGTYRGDTGRFIEKNERRRFDFGDSSCRNDYSNYGDSGRYGDGSGKSGEWRSEQSSNVSEAKQYVQAMQNWNMKFRDMDTNELEPSPSNSNNDWRMREYKPENLVKDSLDYSMKVLFEHYHELELKAEREQARAVSSVASASSRANEVMKPGRPPAFLDRKSYKQLRAASGGLNKDNSWMTGPDWLSLGKKMLGLEKDMSENGNTNEDCEEEYASGRNSHLSMSILGVCQAPFYEEWKAVEERSYAVDDVLYYETEKYEDFAEDGYFSCPGGYSNTGRHHQRTQKSSAFHSVGHYPCEKRVYVQQRVTNKLNKKIAKVLRSVHILQERDRILKNPEDDTRRNRGCKSRRFVVGMREVEKACFNRSARSLYCIVLAPNIDSDKKPGGLDEKILTILLMAEKSNIPVVFGLNRTSMGRAFGKRSSARSTMSVLGILNNTRGNSTLLSDMLMLAKQNSEEWKQCHPYAPSIQQMLHDLADYQCMSPGSSRNYENFGRRTRGYEYPSRGRNKYHFVSKNYDMDNKRAM